MSTRNNLVVVFLLAIILLIAMIVRFYQLDKVPVSLNWDEAAAGYNAYTIANWGKDENGHTLPLIFTSFKDDKHPVHIYTSALFVKLFGPTDFVVRSSAALFGVLNVLLIYFLAKTLFKRKAMGLFAAFLLAISPYNIHFSRGLWETNFALFYFMLGLLAFFRGLEKKNYLLALSFLFFDLSMLSYHSAKVIVPLTIFLLLGLYIKKLMAIKKYFYLGLIIFVSFIMLMIFDPRLTGSARAQQTRFDKEKIQATQLYKKTQSEFLGSAELVYQQYMTHFTPKYLYQEGDQSPRNSTKVFGQFYLVEIIFLVIGIIVLLVRRDKIAILVLFWLLIAPLPSSLVQGAPNATRAMFMLGVVQLISAVGIFSMGSLLKIRPLQYVLSLIIVILLLVSFKQYTDYYFTTYPKKDPHDWQHGMKEIVKYIDTYPSFEKVFMTDERSQPYIFFLYYLKYPLPEYLKTVKYNDNEKNNKYNLISSFDKYNFGNWEELDSQPIAGTLYILTPSQYDGLKYRTQFDVMEVIKSPEGSTEFYLVTAI